MIFYWHITRKRNYIKVFASKMILVSGYSVFASFHYDLLRIPMVGLRCVCGILLHHEVLQWELSYIRLDSNYPTLPQ